MWAYLFNADILQKPTIPVEHVFDKLCWFSRRFCKKKKIVCRKLSIFQHNDRSFWLVGYEKLHVENRQFFDTTIGLFDLSGASRRFDWLNEIRKNTVYRWQLRIRRFYCDHFYYDSLSTVLKTRIPIRVAVFQYALERTICCFSTFTHSFCDGFLMDV